MWLFQGSSFQGVSRRCDEPRKKEHKPCAELETGAQMFWFLTLLPLTHDPFLFPKHPGDVACIWLWQGKGEVSSDTDTSPPHTQPYNFPSFWTRHIMLNSPCKIISHPHMHTYSLVHHFCISSLPLLIALVLSSNTPSSCNSEVTVNWALRGGGKKRPNLSWAGAPSCHPIKRGKDSKELEIPACYWKERGLLKGR